MSHAPAIEPVASGVERPFWSVVIPTYNPGPLLTETLRSVLAQAPGPERMQIAVFDDASPRGDVETLVRDAAGQRVEVYRHDQNVGVGGNWNRAIRGARGRWVHILHQDDHVLPGFYGALEAGIDANPAAGMALTRHLYMDCDGHWTKVAPLLARFSGALEDWLGTICAAQCVQCPAVVVRRDTYERLGGFSEDLRYVLDWEMWIRIARQCEVYYEPTPLAIFRTHALSLSNRLWRTGENIHDVHRGIALMAPTFPAERRDELVASMRKFWRAHAMDLAVGALLVRDRDTALAQLRAAAEHDPGIRRTKRYWRLRWWATKIALRNLVSGQPQHVQIPDDALYSEPPKTG